MEVKQSVHVNGGIDGPSVGDDNTAGRMSLVLLLDCISRGLLRENILDAPRLEATEELSQILPSSELEVCRKIGDIFEMNFNLFQQDELLQSKIDYLLHKEKSPMVKTVLIVAGVIFGDVKELNWGRIAGVFYFASEICVQTVKRGKLRGFDVKDWIKQFVIEFSSFFKEHFGTWITAHGGLQAILIYYSTPIAAISVLAISTIVAFYISYKFN